MKKLGKMGKGGMLKQAMRAMTGKGGGLPDLENFDPAKMAEAQKMLQDPRGLGGQLGKAGLPGGLSGMFGKKRWQNASSTPNPSAASRPNTIFRRPTLPAKRSRSSGWNASRARPTWTRTLRANC